MKPFTTRFGKLPQLQLPSSLISSGVLILEAADLRVLVALIHLHKSKCKYRRLDDLDAFVKVTQKVLMKRTGYPRAATISDAIKKLQAAGFVEVKMGSPRKYETGCLCRRHIFSLNPVTVSASQSFKVIATFWVLTK